MRPLTPLPGLERTIHLIRGQRVMLDADLARIYGVTTKRLNEQVERNRKRFPADFVFRLTRQEWARRGIRPYAFTEHGAVMAAAILGTPTAVRASIHVVRAFHTIPRLEIPRRQTDRFTLHPPIWAKKPGHLLHRPHEPRGSGRMSP